MKCYCLTSLLLCTICLQVRSWRLTILSLINKDALTDRFSKLLPPPHLPPSVVQVLDNVYNNPVALEYSKLIDTINSNEDFQRVYSSIQQVPALHNIIEVLSTKQNVAGIEFTNSEALLLSSALSFMAYALPIISTSDVVPGEPYGLSDGYNFIEAKKYFRRRPFLTIIRSLEIGLKSSAFGLSLLVDKLQGKLLDPNREAERANQVCDLLTNLGPTFIKVGQSLSIRTDLLRPGYILALTQLQDRVPSFPTAVAREILSKELKSPVDSIFSSGLEPTASVVAAASLGQVFKARLRGSGMDVAVKIQRPNIVENVALDMHILREIAPVLRDVLSLNSDLPAIVDDWGRGFVDELDYRKEADNARIFTKSFSSSPLSKIVFAPEVVADASSRKVLTTRWIDGERLEKSSSEDINQLCSIAMNSYLTMLLDGEILHSDPHPGNLRRTPDGRLCIMDWGLTTSVSPDLQITLIEHVAHLVSRDYAKVPSDLVKLGFVPAGKEEVILNAGVVEVLADIYGQWANGGGAAKIDINAVVNQINGLADKYGNLFQLPPYFAYIARAFAVLEGIGLSNDPEYSILSECLPYISQRLLVGVDEKTEGALNTFIFGKEKENVDRVIDPERLRLLLKGVNKYSKAVTGLQPLSASSTAATTSAASIDIGSRVDAIADSIFDFIFSSNSSEPAPRVTPLQKVIIEEVGKIIGAGSRQTWLNLRLASGFVPTLPSLLQESVMPSSASASPSSSSTGSRQRTVLGLLLDPMGLFSGSNLIEYDEQDRRILNATTGLMEVIVKEYLLSKDDPLSMSSNVLDPVALSRKLQSELGLDAQAITKVAQVLMSKIWTRRTQLTRFGALIASEVLKQSAKRLEVANPLQSSRSRREESLSGTTPLPDVVSFKVKEPVPLPIVQTSLLPVQSMDGLSRSDKARAMLKYVKDSA